MLIKQLYFDRKSEGNCTIAPFVERVKVGYSPLFENKIIAEGVPVRAYEEDFFGVWSHKAKQKIISAGNKGFNFVQLKERVAKAPTQIDVIGFHHRIKKMLIFSDNRRWHLETCMQLLCEELGLEYKSGKPMRFAVMQNHFLARPCVYRAYILDCLRPAIEALGNIDLAWKPMPYELGVRGVEYSYIPFILEKLFSVWLENNKKVQCMYYKDL